jgi:transcriptional regulator with XRE-family HTH domain
VFDSAKDTPLLSGHALRNAHLREHSLARAATAPPLARAMVRIRAETLGMTRLEFARRSGISRGTLRDLELGVHSPTRATLRQFVQFCRRRAVDVQLLEELQRLYTGAGATLGEWIARLELRAGSPRELARRVGISPATLWEYRRGHFPLPYALLHLLCKAVGEDPGPGEALWHEAERRRLLDRGYPEALAEFWVVCGREGYSEKRLLKLGVSTAAARRMRYLELPAWDEVADAARDLCRDEEERRRLEALWRRQEEQQRAGRGAGFGGRVQQLRKKQGVSRRELADLFGIGGKKPARIIKYIEEDGFYSAQAYPAGLAALLAGGTPAEPRLLELWQERRRQFHRRHRPETRVDLRLAREVYGFGVRDMQAILGYDPIEYQRIERGTVPLRDTARERILQAVHEAGRRRIDGLLRQRADREAARDGWHSPTSVPELVTLLAGREGGLIPLARLLRRAGVRGLWPGRLRAVGQGLEVPPWYVLERIGRACDVPDLSQAWLDWTDRYRERLRREHLSPLGVELRLLIAEVAPTLRDFSPRLGFNYSVLVRDLQRIDRDEPIKWYHVERVLRALGLTERDERWRELHALWYTAGDRRKRNGTAPGNGVRPNGLG